MKKKNLPAHPLSYSESINRLEAIVQSIETEGVTLEESLSLFEEGMRLTHEVQTMLSSAEQQVTKILETNGQPTTAPFDPDNE